jgi:hypothetical protein
MEALIKKPHPPLAEAAEELKERFDVHFCFVT